MTAFIHKNDFIYTSSNEIQAICQPLYTKFDINMFNYYRFFKSGHFYGLITTPDLVEHHTSNNYVVTPTLNKPPVNNKFHYILLPDLDDGFSQVVQDYKRYFNVFYPLYLYERHHDYFDLFFYHYSGPVSGAFDYYISNMNHLEKWQLEFKEKATDLISLADKNRILIPDHLRANEHNYDFESKLISKDIRINPYHLTNREMECARYLSKGMPAKLIAKILGISYRTIESHITNIKRKTNSFNKCDLMLKLNPKYV